MRLQPRPTVAASGGQEAGSISKPTQPVSRSFASLPQEQDKKEQNARESLNRLPRLMDFPEIVWPSALNSLKNWITIQFIIRPYFDSEFQLKDFIYGAKQALQVRHGLSIMKCNDINSLIGSILKTDGRRLRLPGQSCLARGDRRA